MLSILDDLSQKSWTVQNDWLAKAEVDELRGWAQAAHRDGLFKTAGIGRQLHVSPQIRNDQILWLQPDLSPLIGQIWARFEELRETFNRELYLGIDHFEIHLAVYPADHFYQAHFDQAKGTHALSGERVISSVLYLNSDWTLADGGELVFLEPQAPHNEIQCIDPQGGRLVLFKSDSLYHEVRSPRRERWSLTGWFRRR